MKKVEKCLVTVRIILPSRHFGGDFMNCTPIKFMETCILKKFYHIVNMNSVRLSLEISKELIVHTCSINIYLWGNKGNQGS